MRYTLLTIGISLLLISCHPDDTGPKFSCGAEVSLEMDIMPIVNANCAISQCHQDGEFPFLTSKQAVIDHANDIRGEVVSRNMPPGGQVPLSAEEIDLIKCWVDDGALNN